MTNAPILVIGATGKTGARVAARLDAKGHSVRHGTRRAAIPFDWDAPETWGPVLDGALISLWSALLGLPRTLAKGIFVTRSWPAFCPCPAA